MRAWCSFPLPLSPIMYWEGHAGSRSGQCLVMRTLELISSRGKVLFSHTFVPTLSRASWLYRVGKVITHCPCRKEVQSCHTLDRGREPPRLGMARPSSSSVDTQDSCATAQPCVATAIYHAVQGVCGSDHALMRMKQRMSIS